MFGKMMSIPDELMWSYYELITDRTPEQITGLKAEVSAGKIHPMDAKMQLAQEVIAPFPGPEAARKAADNFQRVFRDRQAPSEVPVVKLSVEANLEKKLTALLVDLKFAPSKSEAERLIKQGGVEIDGQRVSDPQSKVSSYKKNEFLLRAGKKNFVKVAIG
jgi:tyrosyl-tRNA synthetase